MKVSEFCKANQMEYIFEEWDKEKNQKIDFTLLDAASHKKLHWKCEKGHNWQAEVKDRLFKRAGCPYCSGRKVLIGFNDLETTAPVIAAQWHPDKNADVTPTDVTAGSEKKVWWQCERGHEWQATIENRVRKGNSCPYCSGKRAWPGFNDLETLYPQIARQWHSGLNRDLRPDTVRPGCGKKVWWICSEGHIWEARIFSRTSKRAPGCPICAGNAKKRRSLEERVRL